MRSIVYLDGGTDFLRGLFNWQISQEVVENEGSKAGVDDDGYRTGVDDKAIPLPSLGKRTTTSIEPRNQTNHRQNENIQK